METSLAVDELLRYLIDERQEGVTFNLPAVHQEKLLLLRALLALRPPKPMDREMLALQDHVLLTERGRKTLVDPRLLPTVKEVFQVFDYPFASKLVLWRGDITTLGADGIVNAANPRMLGCFVPLHRCIDNAIHTAAGVELRLACHQLMARQGREEPPGRVKMTRGYNLPASYVLHTVGPFVQGPVTARDCRLLVSCYQSCIERAAQQEDLRTLAFCSVSTGEYGFPRERAAPLALSAVCQLLESGYESLDRIVFNVFTEEDYHEYAKLFNRPYQDISPFQEC